MPLNEQNKTEELLMPMEWMEILKPYHTILDRDGWEKGNYRRSFAEPITQKEFEERIIRCVVVQT